MDLEPASIDLVEWILPIIASTTSERGPDDLKIPLFLLQMTALRSDTPDIATSMFVALITRLDRETTKDRLQADAGSRYLILNLVAAAEEKWPGIFE